ncbi:COG3014 family protein [Vibrio furnissii]|uniref:COG3014 family protein n=1 Tax=Vibrio furnissii TaxID=29494 RepID=UPI0012AEAAA2|nr:hypothetical protein [Vibrio furnissii]
MKFHIRHLTISLTCVWLSACANFTAGNLFSHYSAQNADLYQSVKSGDYQQATDEFSDYVAGDILDNLEKGRVYFLNRQYPESKSAFELSDTAIRRQQDQAVISLSSTASSVGALAVNDNLNEYTPADYELGFLHLYLGLNYLQNNSLEGALVEMRRANQVQEQARKSREAELERAQQEMQSKGVTPNLGSVLARYPDAGKTLQAVQNGYLLYLSALLYEASNDLNSAYVDYRRALAVAPDNRAVIDGTIRVAQRLGMREDLAQLTQRYGQSQSLSDQQGRVIVLDEQGVVQALESWRLSLPLFDSRGNTALYSLALPYYGTQSAPRFSALVLNGESLASDRLTDVDLMAQRDLRERMPTIVIRQALRVVAKDQLRKEATKGDDVGSLIFNIFNTLTEQPDTRSWLTLPGAVSASSTVVTAGEQSLQVGGQTYTFSVPSRGTTLVWLSRQGNHATLWHKQLGRL